MHRARIRAIPDNFNIFDEVSSKNPIPAIIVDKKGRQITDFGGSFTAPSIVAIKNSDNEQIDPAEATGLNLPVYDYASLSYTGDNLTSVVFKTGGSGGTTVATLTLVYSGSNLTSVTKT